MRGHHFCGRLTSTVLLSVVFLVQCAFSSTKSLKIEATGSKDAMVQFLQGLSRGDYVQIRLAKGKSVEGLFISYDDYYERVWYIPPGQGGLFKEKSVRVESIKGVEKLDKKVQKKIAAERHRAVLEQSDESKYQLIEVK